MSLTHHESPLERRSLRLLEGHAVLPEDVRVQQHFRMAADNPPTAKASTEGSPSSSSGIGARPPDRQALLRYAYFITDPAAIPACR